MNAVSETIAAYNAMAIAFADRTMGLPQAKWMAPFANMVGGRRRVLDLGCGPGRDTARLRNLGLDPLGCDLSPELIRLGRQHDTVTGFIQADMRHLPFAAGSFDGVWLCAALLHVPRSEAPKVLSEVRRTSKPGAALYVSLQSGDGERFWDEPHGGRRFFCYYRRDELVRLLREAGFGVRNVDDAPDPQRPNLGWLHAMAAAA